MSLSSSVTVVSMPWLTGTSPVVMRPQPPLARAKKVLQHHVAGATSFLAHVDIAHRRHDDAVFDGELVNFDGREELVKRIELLCHAGRSATGICGGPAVE